METCLQVLSEAERSQIHERTLSILAKTGVKVDTMKGRQILAAAGAEVDPNSAVVRFPRTLVEQSLLTAPRKFSLGARREGWDLEMNAGDCTLLIDGEAMFVIDPETEQRRPSTFDDWQRTTRLIDAIDEIGVYWSMVEGGEGQGTPADMIRYWRTLFSSFSKHVQDAITDPELAPWLSEVLQILFGDTDSIRNQHPLSFLLCPQSPLVIEGPYTDAYLALVDYEIPVAVMPMPLMGATSPGSLFSTVILGNCEVLAMLCLLQAAAPGTPIIYAPALATMNPRSGSYSGGAIENGLLGAAAVEMAAYYGLPVEASGFGTDHYLPGIQASYERALNGLLPALAWPDILVGPGLLGGSMILSLEQLILDVEVFRMCKRAHHGFFTEKEQWLDKVIERIGPAGNFLSEPSTVRGIRGGEWHLSDLGLHDTYESWERAGKPELLEEVRAEIGQLLKTHRPLPLDENAEKELDRIEKRAKEGY